MIPPKSPVASKLSTRATLARQPDNYLTVAAVASALGVRRGKILNWIARGELAAVNIADRACGRPRWRIPQMALDAFLAMRACRPPGPVNRTRRRTARPPGFIEYF
jgi:excisionase family DNA binding protein